MKKIILMFAVLLLSSTYGNIVHAAAIGVCDGCTNIQKMEVATNIARNLNQTNGVAYIGDSNSRIITPYNFIVFPSTFGEELPGSSLTTKPGASEVYAYPVTYVPFEVKNEFEEYWDAIQYLKDYVFEVPEDIADTSWDIIGSSSTRNEIFSEYYNSQSLLTRAWNRVRTFFSSVRVSVGPYGSVSGSTTLEPIRMTFRNGGFIIVHHLGFDSDGKPILVVDLGQSEGPNGASLLVEGGDIIELNGVDPTGFGVPDGIELNDFVDAMVRLQGGTGDVINLRAIYITVTCTWYPDESRLVCPRTSQSGPSGG